MKESALIRPSLICFMLASFLEIMFLLICLTYSMSFSFLLESWFTSWLTLSVLKVLVFSSIGAFSYFYFAGLGLLTNFLYQVNWNINLLNILYMHLCLNCIARLCFAWFEVWYRLRRNLDLHFWALPRESARVVVVKRALLNNLVSVIVWIEVFRQLSTYCR